jgi:hypothetical protein
VLCWIDFSLIGRRVPEVDPPFAATFGPAKEKRQLLNNCYRTLDVSCRISYAWSLTGCLDPISEIPASKTRPELADAADRFSADSEIVEHCPNMKRGLSIRWPSEGWADI